MLLSSRDCFDKYGSPTKELAMVVWDVPKELEVGSIPNKIYCNKDMVAPLTAAFKNIKWNRLGEQVRTWDGSFNVRGKIGNPSSYSLHSWGVAIDINAAWNGYGRKVTMSKELVACFMDTGFFDWGGLWGIPDGMHFQLKREVVIK